MVKMYCLILFYKVEKNEILLKHLAKRGINFNVVDSRDKTILDEIFT